MRNKIIACLMAVIVLALNFNGFVLRAAADDTLGMGKSITISSASLDASGSVSVGTTFNATVTVTNTSGARLENIYVETSVSSANISIQSFSRQDVGALAAGESYTVYFSYKIPDTATSGESQIKFTASANGASQDSYQTNLSVIGESKPSEAYFEILSAMAPSKISAVDDNFKIGFRFAVRGGGANNVKVEWTTASAEGFEANSPQVKSYGFMMPGTSEYLEFDICPTDKVKPGSHTFAINISGTNAEKLVYEVGILVEKGEGDDSRGIKVISTSIPESAKTGDKFQIKNVLENTGSAVDNITVTLTSPDGIANNSLAILKIPSLGKNEQKEITFDLFVTASAIENYNMFKLVIEYGNAQSVTHYMGLNVIADKSQDIKIASTNIPESAKKGDKFQIKATVVNEGSSSVKNISVTLKNPAGIVNNSSNIVQVGELKKGEKKEISFDLLASDTAVENYNLFELVIAHDDVTKSQYVGLNITFDGKPTELSITTNLAKNIKHNTDFKLSFTVKNNGGDIKNLIVSIPNPDGVANKTTNTFLEPLLKSGASITKEITFTAKEEAAGNYCLFLVSASTKDVDGKETVHSTQYTGIAVDSIEEKSEYDPALSIDSIDIPYSTGLNSDFRMQIKVSNKGTNDAEAKNVVLTLEPQAGVINKTSNTVKIDSLKPGESSTIDCTFMATEAAANGYNAINLKLAYSYTKADGKLASGEQISQYSGLIVVNPKKEDDPSDKENKLDVPVVIISRFDFGGEEVYGGRMFNFTLEFLNTHKSVAVQDLKITLSQEKGIFNPRSGSNTFFIERLEPGQTVEKSLEMVVKTDTQPDSYGLTVTLSYKNEKGDAETATEVINIPVQQEIRFTVWDIPVINDVNMGDEAYVNVQFANEGKSTIYNVKVTVVSDQFYDPDGGYPAGNLEAGKTASKAFYLMPTQAGMVTGKIRFEYEDANNEMTFREVDISFMVMGGDDSGAMMRPDMGGAVMLDENGQPVMSMEGEMPEENKSFFKWLFTDMGILQWLIVIGVPVVVIAIVVVIVIVIRRKRAKIKEDDDDL